MNFDYRLTRRDMLLATAATALSARFAAAAEREGFALKYLLGSCMYGYADVREILPEVRKTGAAAIDLWPKVHGSQREQIDALGEERFAALLKEHDVALGCLTRYDLGPFGLRDELRLAARLGCGTIVTGAKGPKGLTGGDLKAAVRAFAEAMKPEVEAAEAAGVTIAIENHGANLIESPDSLKWLAEFRPGSRLAVALAPYHLPQDAEALAGLIRDLGDAVAVFYAWQHGMGCMTKLPKEQELLQMPGRGDLDFGPPLAALRETGYAGWTEIFMHPVPRGVPILDSTAAVTAEIVRARRHLEGRLAAL